MKNNKIDIGQCYVVDDHVYMIMQRGPYNDFWELENTITKERFAWCETYILELDRVFENFS